MFSLKNHGTTSYNPMFCFLKKILEELFCETYHHACLCKQQRLRLICASLLVTHIENFTCDNNSSVMSGLFQDEPREMVSIYLSIYEPPINSMSLQNEEMVCLWDRKRNGSTITGKYSCRKMFEDELRC